MMIIVLQLLFRFTGRPFDEDYVRSLARLLGVFILVVFYFLLVENLYRVYLIGSREAQWYFLFGGFHSVVFWVGLMFLGIFVPALILFSPGIKNSIKMINVAAVLHVAGVLCERYIIVIPGQTHPADILPNMHVETTGLLAEKVGYSVSFLEFIQALGIAAIVALAFILGLKFFAMLPTKALIADVTGAEDTASTG